MRVGQYGRGRLLRLLAPPWLDPHCAPLAHDAIALTQGLEPRRVSVDQPSVRALNSPSSFMITRQDARSVCQSGPLIDGPLGTRVLSCAPQLALSTVAADQRSTVR